MLWHILFNNYDDRTPGESRAILDAQGRVPLAINMRNLELENSNYERCTWRESLRVLIHFLASGADLPSTPQLPRYTTEHQYNPLHPSV